MHCRAAERVDLFLRNFLSPDERIDSRLMKQRSQQAEENRHVLRQIVVAVEFWRSKHYLSVVTVMTEWISQWKALTGATLLSYCSFWQNPIASYTQASSLSSKKCKVYK